MPVIHQIDSVKIKVYPMDHQPAHVHVVLQGGRDAQVIIDDLTITSRTLKAKDIADALAWIADNREFCRMKFQEYQL